MTAEERREQNEKFVDEQLENLKAHWLSADDPQKTREAARVALIDRICSVYDAGRPAGLEDAAKVAENLPGAKDDEELWTPTETGLQRPSAPSSLPRRKGFET